MKFETSEKIEQFRDTLGWTQERMAQELGISWHTFHRLETGQSRISRRTDLALRYLYLTTPAKSVSPERHFSDTIREMELEAPEGLSSAIKDDIEFMIRDGWTKSEVADHLGIDLEILNKYV